MARGAIGGRRSVQFPLKEIMCRWWCVSAQGAVSRIRLGIMSGIASGLSTQRGRGVQQDRAVILGQGVAPPLGARRTSAARRPRGEPARSVRGIAMISVTAARHQACQHGQHQRQARVVPADQGRSDAGRRQRADDDAHDPAGQPTGRGLREPDFFIIGMVNEPDATTLATPEPQIVGIGSEDRSAACPGPPLGAPAMPRGKVVEQVQHPRPFQDGREDHGDEDAGSAEMDRATVVRLGADGEMLNDATDAAAAKADGRGQVPAQKATGQKGSPDHRQGPAAALPSRSAPERSGGP